MWSAFTDPLRGKTALWKVIWIYGFGVSVLYTVLGGILVPETPLGIGVYVLLGLLLGIVQSAMLYQCAYNSRFPAAGRWLRIMVIAGLVAMPLLLYVVFKNPESLTAIN